MRAEAALQTTPGLGGDPGLFRIRAGVARVERRDSVVLVAPEDGKALRMTPVALDLIPLLGEGARFDDMAAVLQEKYPRAGDARPKLKAFLDQLQAAGFLDTGAAAKPRRWRLPRYSLFNPDPAAARVATALRVFPDWLLWSVLGLALTGSVLAIAALAWSGGLPHPSAYVRGFDLAGFLVFALVVLPVHEAGHAVACRLAGAKVNDAGIVLHGFLMPGPYVDTTHAYRLPRRLHRFWIPAAGPTVDLLAAGTAAALLLALGEGHPAAPMVTYVMLLALLFVYLDTNPLGPTDGSHMLEAVLDDELARVSALSRRRARLSNWKTVAKYRIAASLHVQAAAVLAIAWWLM